jgi:hypothetical protein
VTTLHQKLNQLNLTCMVRNWIRRSLRRQPKTTASLTLWNRSLIASCNHATAVPSNAASGSPVSTPVTPSTASTSNTTRAASR